MSLSDEQQAAMTLCDFLCERSSPPFELREYFFARRIAAMHYERKHHHDACDKWTAIAYERLVDALAQPQGMSLTMYLDGTFNPLNDDFESLPRAFKRVSKKKIMAAANCNS